MYELKTNKGHNKNKYLATTTASATAMMTTTKEQQRRTLKIAKIFFLIFHIIQFNTLLHIHPHSYHPMKMCLCVFVDANEDREKAENTYEKNTTHRIVRLYYA